jgi:hypothetical protein
MFPELEHAGLAKNCAIRSSISNPLLRETVADLSRVPSREGRGRVELQLLQGDSLPSPYPSPARAGEGDRWFTLLCDVRLISALFE